MKRSPFINPLQAVIAAPTFCVGVCCSEAALLEIRYLEPQAESLPENALAAEAVRQIRAYLADPAQAFDLPLAVSGSAFQRRVWQQIAEIPLHRTRSYGEIAGLLESAPRAVGQACGANPFPLVIPCHRVIAADGRLGGFARQRGGFLLDVKRWLLSHETRR